MQKSAMQKLFERRGHILTPSVKCHPETAGKGIEYVWGLAERHFRKNNDRKAKHLEENVIKSLSPDSIPQSTIFNFERKTRDYMRLYLELGINQYGPLSFTDLENRRRHIKNFRSHRKVAEIDRDFIDAVM